MVCEHLWWSVILNKQRGRRRQFFLLFLTEMVVNECWLLQYLMLWPPFSPVWPSDFVRKCHCHCPAMWCHFVNGPCHVVASSLHDVTLVGNHSYFIILRHSLLTVDCCFVVAGSWVAGFFWLWQTALVYSVPVGGMYCIYDLCLFDNYCSKTARVMRIRE